MRRPPTRVWTFRNGAGAVIWEWLFGQVVGLVEWVGAQLGAMVPPVPGWVLSIAGMVARVASAMSGLGAWFPVELVAPVVIAVVLTFTVGLAIKVVRIVASFLTLGGGGAG